MLLLSIIAYLVLTILVGVWASRRVKTSDDYMLAGRSLPLLLSSSAMFATWFGSETVFGASSEFLKGGLYAVIEDPFGASFCLVLFGMFYVRRLYNMNLLTLGDFFKVKYGKTTELVASIFLAPPYIGYIAAQLVAMGLILNVVTGIAVWEGVVISAVVVTVYTYIGGMWAITITDFIQTIIIIAGLLIVAVILAVKAGGVSTVISEMPRESFRFLPAFEVKEIAAYVAAWCVLGLGSIPSQDVFQRSMSSNSVHTAVRSCYLAAALYMTIAMLPLFISLCTRHLYPDQINGDTQLALPSMVLMHTTLPVQIMFFGSLLSAIMSTTSSAILAPAAIFSENVVKPLARHRYSDRQLLILTRLSVLIFSVLATVMACMRSNIYELVGESSILSLVSLFAPLTFGLYWKRTSRGGALAGMVLGMLTWIIFEFCETSWPSLIPATVVSVLSVVGGSLLWPKNEKHDQDRVKTIE
ncbi:sodium:solute symporter family protein [Fulvivirgaceae bacterium PWU4]|uniref:Sodium:solute symporter family protein n=1 Tax=Chryseosolibacter histidini TaxID=2782349 RepID=A0AAP2DL00_9BACT|nr:sodium:solute symporter family protein [Chryseosolibacter histidini]MBT1696897.1 sodium:solute symporter family protein [Chryseosolibacter histidini]